MKTHLPVALRKALLAALVLVSASVYNRVDAMTVSGAYQGNNINMALFDVVTNPDDGVIHDDNTIRGKSVTIDTDIGDANDDGNNEITAGAGGISMTGDIVSGNNALTAQGSFISIDGDIAGSDNTLKVEGDGDVKVTGGITGDKASLEITGNGNMSTGDISGDYASIKVAGTGQLETGAITGEGAQVDAKGMTLTSLNDMKGATMSVAGVEATLQDTNATLDNSSITSTGNVAIGADDAGSEETDVLSLKNGSSIAATDVVDGAGNVIYGSMNIDQNVSLDGGSSLSTTGGNVEVSGQVKGTSSSISTAGAGSVILGSIASATEDLRIDAENGDIEVGTIEGDQGVDRLQITTNGSLSIGTSDKAALTNARISAATGIEIGDTPGAGALLDIRGREDDAGSTLIETDGNLVVNQSVSIHPGENESSTAGDVTVTAGGTMAFLGESTTIAGGDGNDATAYIKADGDITFDNAKGAEIGQKATVESTGGNVTMTAGEAAQNLISGVVDSAGMVSSTAGSTLIMGTESTRAEVNAKSGIFIEGTGSDNGNGVAYALVSTETGNVSMVSPKFNAVFGSEIEAVNGGVAMSEGYASVSGSNITAGAGDVSITGTSAEVSNDTITASEAVIIAGTDVDGTGTGVSDVIATGNSIQIGDANTDTTIGSLGDADTLKTVLSATENVQVDGADVVISGETEIVSSNGDAMITATGDAQISETSVSADGEVCISATGTASVDTVKLSGDSVTVSGTDASVTGSTIEGESSVVVDGTTSTAVAGTTITNSGAVTIGESGTGTTTVDSTSIAASGNVSVAGDSVTITDNQGITSTGGDVTITANDGDASIAGGEVEADGDVEISATGMATVDTVKVSGDTVSVSGTDASVTGSTIEGETSVVVDGTTTTNVAGTTIKNSGEVTIGESGIGTTKVESTSIAASGNVSVAGDTVTITDNQGITSTGGDVTITANDGDASITGDEVEADGEVSISATGMASVDTVKLSGDTVSVSGTDASVTDSTIEGETSVVVDGTTTTNVAGTTIKNSGEVTIGEFGIGTTQVENTSIAASGDVSVAGDSVTITDNQGITSTGGDVTITANDGDASITGDEVEADGEVSISATGTASVDTVKVSGDTVSVSGTDASVTDSTIEGETSVVVDGTTTTNVADTTIKNSGEVTIGESGIGTTQVESTSIAASGDVSVAGDSVTIADNQGITSTGGDVTITANDGDASITGDEVEADGEVSISATGEATLTDVKIAGGDVVSINAETVTVTDNKGIISDMGSVKVIGSNGLVSITDGKVSAATEVELGGTLGTSIDGVEIDGKSISVGISGDTTIGNNSTLEAMSDIDVVGDSVEITDTSIDSTMGKVTIEGSTTTTTLTNTSVNGKDISIYGETQTTLTDSNVDAIGYVEIAGQETAELRDTSVSGDNVELSGGDITVVGGSTVQATGDDIIVNADSLTVGTLGNSMTEDTLTAMKNIDITVSDSATIQGASQVVAKGGNVDIDGGLTSTNTITGMNTLVDAVQGSVSISGDTNTVSDNAEVTAKVDVTIDAATSNDILSGSTVTAETGSVAITGPTNTIDGDGTVVTGQTTVSITGETANTISGNAQVVAKTDSVTIAGGTTAANTIEGTDTLVDAATNVDIDGATNTIQDGAEVVAGTDVTIDAATSNDILSGSTVTAETGSVAITGPTNTIDGDGTVVTGQTTVSIAGETANTISGNAQVVANTDSVTIDGGTTAANTIEGADTLVDAATNVDIDGALNTIQEGAAVVAGTNVTIDAATGNVVQGGATVTAGTSIDITAEGTAEYNGNLISDATLTATTGDINVRAAKGNEIAFGAVLTATSGKVTITGTSVNLVSGADTTVTAGAVTIDGGDTAINVVDDAKVDAVGDAGKVDMDGATNIIRNGAEVLADAGITMDSNSAVAGNGNLVSASVLETENGNIELTSKLVNVIQEDARVKAIDGAVAISGTTNNIIEGAATEVTAGNGAVTIDGGTTALNIINDAKVNACGTDGVVTMKGESNLIANEAEVLATGNIMIDSAGTDATSGNVIDASTVQTETGNIAIQAANINLVKNGSSVDALTGEVTMKGVANLITTNAEVLAETGIDITSTGSGDNHGNKVSASTVQTETGDVDITATMHNHVTDKAGVTATNGDVNLRGKSNTIDAAAYVNAGDVAFIKADEKNTITGEDTKVTAGRTAWIQGADNEISAGALVEGEDYATIKATGDNTITGAGTKVTAGVTAQVFGENNEISAGALVNGDQYVMIDAAEHNRIFGAKTVVQGGNNVQIIAGTYNVVDAASVKTTEQGGVALRAKENNIVQNGALVNTRGGSITLTSVGDDATVANTVRGEGTRLAAETYVKLDGVGNTVSSGADIRAVQEVYMTATEDNVITDSGTQVYAGGAVSLDGKNNTITKDAVVIGLTGVSANADENNFITEGAKVSALNDDASVTLTAGVVNQIAGAATEVYAGKDVSMTAETINLIDAATVTAMNGEVTMGNAAGTPDTVVNSIQTGAVVTAGTDVSMTGDKNAILAGSGVTAIAGSVTMTGASYNAVSGSTVKAGTDVTLTGDKATVDNVITDSTVAAGNDVAMTGENNTIDAASTVNAGADVTLDAAENNVINGASDVTAMGSVDIDAGKSNLIAEAAIVTAGQNVSITGEESNIIDASTVTAVAGEVTMGNAADTPDTVVNSIQTGAVVTAGTDVSMTGDKNAILAGSGVTAIADSVTMTGASYNAVSGSTVKAGTDVTLTGDKATVDNVITDSTVAAGNDVAMTGENNTIDAASTVDAGNDVNLDAGNNNVIDGASTVTAAGEVSLAAGTSNSITGDSAVNAGADVTLDAAENNVINGASDVTAMGSVDIDAGKSNLIAEAAIVTAGQNVSITGEESNIIDASTVTAVAGEVTMGNAADTPDTVVNSIQTGAVVTAGTDVSMTGDINNILTGSSVSATQSVTMTGATQNAISESTVKAGTDVTLTGDKATVDNVITDSTVTAGNKVAMTGENNTITETSAVNAGNDATLDAGNNNVINGASKLTAVGSVYMDAVANNIISDSGTQVYAGERVSIDGENNIVTKAAKVIGMQGVDITADVDNTINASAQVLAMNDDASVTITAGEDNLIAGSATKVYAGKDVSITGEVTNTVYAASVTAKTGDITMGNAAGSTDDVVNTITAAAKVTAADDVSMTGDKNAILAGSTVTAGMDVTMTADTQNAVANSTVTANNGSITIGDVDGSTETVQNVITSEAGKTTTLTAKQDVTITGENIISSTDLGSTSIIAQNGNIIINDDNYIKYAEIDAQGAEGDVVITTGTGDKNTWIEDTSITGETVTVAGDTSDDRSTANLAVVTGAEMEITSRGEDDGVGITLNNVSVLDTEKGASNIIAEAGGNIVLLNRVDVENGTLTIEDGMTSDARIVLDAGNVLNTKEASSLEGRLTGEGDINKSGGDDLLLDYDHTEFNGTIYANGAVGGAEGSVVDASNVGSWIEITSEKVGADQMAGVGEDATIVLKSTDLVISTTEAQIGTLDTTQDEAGMNNVHTTGGTLVSLGGGSDGSYTMDDNTRVDFTTVGSVLEVNMGTNGDVVHATNMKLSDATLLKLDATVDGAGQASSDIIEASGTINVAAKAGLNSTSTATAPSTARVYINHTDMAAAAKAAEGARTTIMSGTMVTNINEDVLYDVAQSANGTYQRELLDRNVHLENKGDHVDLVYSKNYRTCAKTPQMNYVAGALKQISDTFHHAEGVLAASNNRLHNLIDAFDYTRSEGAAQRGLQSVAGTSLVLPRLMMFDSSRRHIEQLRKQITMPGCNSVSNKGVVIGDSRYSNAWVTYTGSYDYLEGDTYMGDYRRKAHGAMVGVDHSLSCKLRLGLSLGYENSDGYADDAHVDADTFFVDVYAAGVTGRFKHRASVGLATSSYDTSRYVLVEAGYHTFRGHGDSSVDATTLNFGYEISTDIELGESSRLTPYAALNLSWHSLDTGVERGMGEAGLYTKCDNEWQSEIVLGVAYSREFTALPNQAPALFYANAGMHLELFNDRVTVQNRFIGSPYGWRAESMKRKPLYFELGAGVAVPLTPSWTGTAGAAVETGVDRNGVSGNVGVRYQF